MWLGEVFRVSVLSDVFHHYLGNESVFYTRSHKCEVY